MVGYSSNNAADLLVIFGITGDLARKMTLRALYRLECRKLLDCPILGVASRQRSGDELLELARQSISGSGEKIDEDVFNRFLGRLSYVFGDVAGDSLYAQLAQRIRAYRRPLYYLETPPSLFGPIAEHLGNAHLVTDARIAVEKPFGYDLRSARELDAGLHQVLREEQILRVDHFLGKEPVMELEYLRFANLALAEIWDRKSISAMQITIAEDFGVEDRGRFYYPVGALRDVVQNHLLQVLALVAMEPPAGCSTEELQDKKAEVFRAMPAADPQHYVRGQYEGYLEVPGVAPGSTTETFVAVQLEIDIGDGPVFRSSFAPARSCPTTSPRCGCCYVPRLDWRFYPNPQRSIPTRSCCASILTPVCGCRSSRVPMIRGARCTWTRCFVRNWANHGNPTSGCCTPPSSATGNCSPAKTASKKPGASCSRCWITRQTSSPTSPDHGDPLRRNRSAVTTDGSSPG
jgi:Glucose-6-phosphate dehydrogenase, C-terminal domain/Glucose-6-phosphate dehydrogenase, NAD binding domain